MCGIAGLLCLSHQQRATHDDARRMSATLAHRGPDDAGVYVDPLGRCTLGFRRLAIIDLAGGHQPISNEDGTIWLTFNGEIYNYRELRADLLDNGHRFRTESDAEVIVHAFEEWGPDCVLRLAGMFALALWDEAEGRLLLARDRLGKKPLAYAIANGRLAFASETKALLELHDVSRALDPQALHEYLLFQYVPAPRSIYRHVRHLPPASRLECAHGAEVVAHPQRYWTVPSGTIAEAIGGRSDRAYAEARETLDVLLTRAVQKRLVADVPIGAFLSGGIDSSIVVGLMRRLGASPLRTYSIGFADPRFDESAHARTVADFFHTEHHEQIVTPQALEVLDTLAYHYDEPFADSSAIPTYYLSRFTRGGVTVALTGDAGDECFGGYDRYRAARLAGRMDWVPSMVRAPLAAVARLLPRGQSKSLSRKTYRFLQALAASPARRYLAWMNVFTPLQLAAGYSREFREQVELDAPVEWFERLYGTGGPEVVEAAIWTDFASYLPGDLLVKVDRASMACGLECRCPFLDHEVVEFAQRLPVDWRVGPRGGKRILRDWAGGFLPAETLRRSKMGFGVPVGEWFRSELKPALESTLLSGGSLASRIFRADWLRQLIGSHLAGVEHHGHALWSLMMLEHWSRRWNPVT